LWFGVLAGYLAVQRDQDASASEEWTLAWDAYCPWSEGCPPPSQLTGDQEQRRDQVERLSNRKRAGQRRCRGTYRGILI